MKVNFEIKKMEINDIEQVASISEESISKDWDKQQFLYELNENEFANLYVAKLDNKIIGFIDFWITFDSSTISEIAIKKEYRNQGFAGKLIEFMLNLLKNKEVLTSTLEVRKSNEVAISFYKKYEYKDVCIKPKYYKDGEDAIYMMRGIY